MRLKLLFCALGLSFNAFCQNVPAEALRDSLLRGIDLTLHQEYPEARAVFQSVITSCPNNPAGYLYLAGTVQAEFSDYEDGFDGELLDAVAGAY